MRHFLAEGDTRNGHFAGNPPFRNRILQRKWSKTFDFDGTNLGVFRYPASESLAYNGI